MTKLAKIISLILLSLSLMLTLTSCVVRRDINHMNFVLGAAFDYDIATEQYLVHVQVPKTQAFAKGEGTQSGEEAYVVFDGKGKTVFLAIRDMAKSDRVFFWGHCENYIIGSRLARHGIYDAVDFMIRDAEIRGESHILVSNAPVQELLTIPKGLQNVPVLAIDAILEEGLNIYGKGIRTQIDEVFESLLNEGSSYVISLVGLRSPDYPTKEDTKKYDVSGAAVFKGDKMIDVLSPAEARGYNFIMNEIQDTLINIKFRGDDLVIENTSSSANITVYTENGEVTILVEVKPQGNIATVGNKLNLKSPKVVKEIENTYAAAIKRELEDTIERAQTLQLDFLGFGREVEIADPKLWAEIKDRWQQEIFPETEVTVTVKPTVIRTGLTITTEPEDKYAKY